MILLVLEVMSGREIGRLNRNRGDATHGNNWIRRLPALIAFVVLFATTHARADVTTGTLTGRIADQTGAAVSGLRVRAAGREAVTDASGEWRLTELQPAEYRITILDGPAVLLEREVAVVVDSETKMNVLIDRSGRSVTVTARTSMVSSAASGQGVVVDRSRIVSVPLNRRGFLHLALLAPGVMPPVQDSELSSRGSFAMHANGAREEFNNFILDGADNNDPYTRRYVLEPPVDSIQEFRTATSSYSAEYGRAAGAQVNVITRSGTADWHGSGYEYFRNRVLDARNFFDAAGKPRYQRNQFGVEAGGPLIRNRTYVFANLDALRERRGLTRLATVPSAEDRARPAQSDIGRRILALFPLPNRPGLTGNYLAQPVLSETQNQAVARLDHRLGAADQFMLRYAWGDQRLLEPYAEESTDLPGFGSTSRNYGHNIALEYQRVFSAQSINSLRLAYASAFRDTRHQNAGMDVGALWGVPWLGVRDRDRGYPFITVAGYSPIGDVTQLPIRRHSGTAQIIDSLSLLRGGHLLRLGGEVRQSRLRGYLDYFSRGSLTFSGAITGSGIGDLLAGAPSFAIRADFDNPQNYRSTTFAAYAQDEWRLRPRLTLSLGVRYEAETVPEDPRGTVRAPYATDTNNFAPRLGIAWSPRPDTIVRAAYGIFYDPGMLVVNSSLYFNPPLFNVRVYFPSARGLLSLQNPFAAEQGILPPPAPNLLSPDLEAAYLQQWTVSVERRHGPATASIAYVGSSGTHLIRARDLNQPRPGPGMVQLRRPNPSLGSVYLIESAANSSFHSLQSTLELRAARWAQLWAAYTWSKSIDEASAFLATRADRNFPQDSANIHAERALSSYDVPHRLVAAASVRLRGWELQTLVQANSGQPFTPVLRFDNSNTGNSGTGITGADRPDVLRNPNLSDRSPERWFDTAAFAVPAKYAFGNAGRSIVRGAGFATLDAALARTFALAERPRLTVQLQAFNLLNRTNFDLPERFADEPGTFGHIFSAKASRQLQIGLRLAF